MVVAILALALLGAGPPMAEKPLALADPTFLARVKGLGTDWAYMADAFVAVQPSKSVSQERIPADVLTRCRAWIAEMLREPYATKLSAATWTGYANDTHMREIMVASVSVDDVQLTWSDKYDPVHLLLDFGKAVVPDGDEAKEEFLAGVMAKYLKLRDFPADTQQWFVIKLPADSGSLWAGRLWRGATRLPNGRLTAPMGWDRFLEVVTDGRRVLVTANTRLDDTQPGPVSGAWTPSKSRFDK